MINNIHHNYLWLISALETYGLAAYFIVTHSTGNFTPPSPAMWEQDSFGFADNAVNPTAKEFIHAEYGAQVVVSSVMTSAQAPNNHEDYSYVTQLANPKGYFQVSSYRGIVNGQGATANRPAGQTGLQWFDTTIGKPIWYNGTTWVDATGATV